MSGPPEPPPAALNCVKKAETSGDITSEFEDAAPGDAESVGLEGPATSGVTGALVGDAILNLRRSGGI